MVLSQLTVCGSQFLPLITIGIIIVWHLREREYNLLQQRCETRPLVMSEGVNLVSLILIKNSETLVSF